MSNEVKVLDVEGMSCSHCEASIKKAVQNLNGVSNIDIDLESKKVTVKFDSEKVNIKEISQTIEDQGYDVK